MSNLQHNPNHPFFPTETINHQLASLPPRKSFSISKDALKNNSPFSAILLKNKFGSKQRLLTPQLESIVNKIQSFVDDIDNKIQNRVQLVKQVYLNEYKQQVVEMSTQLKNLREKLDNQTMKEKANQKMFYLEEERDFFRHEVIKLNEQMNKLNDENKQLKKQIQEQKSQLNNYKQVVYNLQSKLLKLKSFNVERNKMFQSAVKNSNSDQNKHLPSTIDTKNNNSGSKTQRGHANQLRSLETIQDEEYQEMSRTEYRLRPSQSLKAYPKHSSSHKGIMQSTVTYPRLTVEKLQKIEGYSELLQRQQIVDLCINELKRQIYYRNLSIAEKETKIHFNEISQVKFESFTKTDKKELIIKILSNERILNEFYQFLFNNNANYAKTSQTQIAMANQLINSKLDMNGKSEWPMKKLKFTDKKLNTKELNHLKTEFNKKIFDIKHNR